MSTRDMSTRARTASSNMPAKKDLEAMSLFRYQLRQFLRFSEEVTHAEGVTPLQYQMMLHVRGFEGRQWATVGEIAERLQAAPHGTVALVSRCEASGLVVRRTSRSDRRQVEVHLTAKGERCLARLASQHKSEIEAFGWVFKQDSEREPEPNESESARY